MVLRFACACDKDIAVDNKLAIRVIYLLMSRYTHSTRFTSLCNRGDVVTARDKCIRRDPRWQRKLNNSTLMGLRFFSNFTGPNHHTFPPNFVGIWRLSLRNKLYSGTNVEMSALIPVLCCDSSLRRLTTKHEAFPGYKIIPPHFWHRDRASQNLNTT